MLSSDLSTNGVANIINVLDLSVADFILIGNHT